MQKQAFIPNIQLLGFLERGTKFLLPLCLFIGFLAIPSISCKSQVELHSEELTRFRITRTDPPVMDRGMHVEHYPASNERRIDLFYPYIKDKGGAYIGVGTDQNLTFVAWAKSRYAWFMDFDVVVVYVNKIHLFFLDKAKDAQEFEKLWSKKEKKRSFALLQEAFGKESDWKRYQAAWRVAHRGSSDVPERFRELHYMAKHFPLKTFTNSKEDFSYIKKMVHEGRIQCVTGDLRGKITMQEIAHQAGFLKIPVRVLYLSNAEEYFKYPAQMRKNFLSLPFDEKSVVIRTVTSGAKTLGFPAGERYPDTYPLHYNVQPFVSFRAWMQYRPGKPLRIYHNILRHKGLQKKAQGFSVQKDLPPRK